MKQKLILFFEGNNRNNSSPLKKQVLSWQTDNVSVKTYRDDSLKWYLKDLDEWIGVIQHDAKNYSNIVLIGRSSGGYLAILLSSLLKVSRVIALQPQTFVDIFPQRVKLLSKYPNFLNLKNIINSNVDYYIQTAINSTDKRHGHSHFKNLEHFNNVHHINSKTNLKSLALNETKI